MGVVLIGKASGKAKPDWNRIRTDYITGSDSLRDLSEKYNISWSTLRQRAFREKWGDDRRRTQTKIEQDVIRKTVEKTVDVTTLASEIRRKGLIIIDGLFDDFAQVRATEHRESRQGKTDVKRLRDLTQAFRDLMNDDQNGQNVDSELLQSLMNLERRSES